MTAKRPKRGIIARSQRLETLQAVEALVRDAKGWDRIRQIEQRERDLDEQEWRERYPGSWAAHS